MKTTLDLPEPLVRAMKMRAVREGRKLKDVARDALAAGLATEGKSHKKPAAIVKDKKTGLPVIQCRNSGTLTPDQVTNILIAQEISRASDLDG
jgi:plasmid stability protein